MLKVVRIFTNKKSAAMLGRTESGAVIHLVSMDEVTALRALEVPPAESVLDDVSWASAVGQAKATGAILP